MSYDSPDTGDYQMGTSTQAGPAVQRKKTVNIHGLYKPTHGEMTSAKAHFIQKLKSELLTSLEADGYVYRAQWQERHGEVKNKHISFMNEVFENNHLHFKIEMNAQFIWFSATQKPKPQQ